MTLPTDLDLESQGKIAGILIHLTATRMRLKIPYLQQDPGYGDYLIEQLKSLPGIESIEINRLATSMRIHFQPTQITVPAILSHLHSNGDLDVMGQGNQGWTNLTRAFALEPEQVSEKAQDIGSFVVGGQVGDLLGGVTGAAVGGATLGPSGVVWGTQVGTFVGGVVGARISLEAFQALKQNNFDWQKLVAPTPDSPTVKPPQQLEKELEKCLEIRTSGKAGEVAGEITGGLVGGSLFGPIGEMVGQLLGNMVGGQLAEDTARAVVTPEPPLVEQPTSPSVNIVLEWWVKTSRSFVGETAVATLGGLLLRLILGPQGEAIGLKAGGRAGRLMDWNSEPPNPPAPVATPASSEAKAQEL